MLSHRRRDKFSKIAGMNARIVVCMEVTWESNLDFTT